MVGLSISVSAPLTRMNMTPPPCRRFHNGSYRSGVEIYPDKNWLLKGTGGEGVDATHACKECRHLHQSMPISIILQSNSDGQQGPQWKNNYPKGMIDVSCAMACKTRGSDDCEDNSDLRRWHKWGQSSFPSRRWQHHCWWGVDRKQ